jgi:hypothetical protein
MTRSVDVLVPVHSAQRPVARLAESVLKTTVPVRLIVVAHNVDPASIEAALGRHLNDDRVTVVPFSDGIPSPAGPLRFALENLESPFFMKIDSDDYLADGAIESWMNTQRRFDADIVLPTMRMAGTPRNFPTPPRRPFRTTLDPVRDRLAYRTSTMGLIRSELAHEAIPVPALETAEDLAPALRLWFTGARIVAAETRHSYMVASDAGDRVTQERRSIAAELAFVAPLIDEDFWGGLASDARLSIIAKILRVQVFGALAKRADREPSATELEFVSGAVRSLTGLAPQVWRALSRDDSRLVHELLSDAPRGARVRDLAVRASRHVMPSGLVTARLGDSLRRDAPLRYLGASLLARYRR